MQFEAANWPPLLFIGLASDYELSYTVLFAGVYYVQTLTRKDNHHESDTCP